METIIIEKCPTKKNSKCSYNKSSIFKSMRTWIIQTIFIKIRITNLKDWICYPAKEWVVNNDSHEAYHCEPSICSFRNKPISIGPFKIFSHIGTLFFWKWSLFKSISLIKIIITIWEIAFASNIVFFFFNLSIKNFKFSLS